jgi:FMN phosphatase YigB (HAD superfamily)
MNTAVKLIFFDLGDTLVKVPRTWLPGAKALLNSLKAKGLRLGIISNTGELPDRQAILDLLPADFDINLFDASIILFSSEVDLEKPSKEIFAEAVRRANLPAAQCLYCSENIVETLVAQHVGMRAIRVQSPPNSDLASLESALADFESIV